MELNLTANTPAEEKILRYLKENATENLADKINNGTSFEKDGKPLINKKSLADFMKYACDEARKLAEKGTNFACIDDVTVYGWAIHYFEEDSIEGTLYTIDGEEYKPTVKAKNTQKSTYTPTSVPKPQNRQASLFDIISQQNNTAETTAKEQQVIQNEKKPIKEISKVETKAENKPVTVEQIPATEEKPQKKVSPVYTEYAALKEKYPDCVIAYRLGDFYEILGKDAVTIATELDLTLTSRDCGLDHRIPMIGFPYHTADNYFSKIINRGHKIAIVEKLNDINIVPKEKPCVIDEDTGEILSEEEMREFDGDIEEPDELEEEKAIAKAFDAEAVCELSELLGDCFILV